MAETPTLSNGSPDPRYAGYCECCWPDIDMELALEAEARAYEEDWLNEEERDKTSQAGSIQVNGMSTGEA